MNDLLYSLRLNSGFNFSCRNKQEQTQFDTKMLTYSKEKANSVCPQTIQSFYCFSEKVLIEGL